MNPKLTRKQKELSLLVATVNDLKKCDIDPDINLYAHVAVTNAIFNLKRVIDLVNHIL
jgi:hypothetical protein